ncbi:PIN domain-containing protein [Arthrobacter sp. cf158]|uniref:type II toxin-antitoxin system VapC family toxin n=1 Tax=Arthrobacter sp. cf158 TaxID=1761744 RepID=UPI00089C9515|nr:PIN domain-containing protein [Arthrobacter sp. cf158]SDW32426.1 PIN domain-containing protein [Arthrobacter sp. cf158]
MTLVVVDANVLIAAYIEDDTQHEEAVEIISKLGTPLYVPVLALAEASYFIDRRLGPEAELDFIRAVAEKEISPVYFSDDWPRILEVAARYVDRRMGASDAAVVVAAEKLHTTRIASMDLRDLSGVQLASGDYVDLISFGSQV